MSDHSLKPFLVPLVIGLIAIAYFIGQRSDGSTTVLDDLTSLSYPEEIGVFVETPSGWARVPSHQYDGSYSTARGLTIGQLPITKNSAKVYFNGIPMDPSQVYWVRNVQAEGSWKGPLDQTSMALRPVGPRSYEATIEGMNPGVKNIYLKRGFVGMAHFINIR